MPTRRYAECEIATGLVRNVLTLADPRSADGAPMQITGTVIEHRDPADPQSPLVSKTAVVDSMLRWVGHGLKGWSGPWLAVSMGAALPAPLLEGTRYFLCAVDADHFRVSDAYKGFPINFADLGDGDVRFTEPMPGPSEGCELIEDVGGEAQAGGTWNGTAFAPAIQPAEVPIGDVVEKRIRSRPEMLALARMITNNDALTEDEAVALIRGKLS